MIVISQALTLVPAYTANYHYPVIGWHNLVSASNVSASTSDQNNPASNLARSSTVECWQALNLDEQIITVNLGGAKSDYIGIARHNFGSGLISVSIEGESADTPDQWIGLMDEFIPANNSPIIIRFVGDHFNRIRIRLQPRDIIPRMAVLYIGCLLVMQRGEPSGLTPIPFAADDDVIRARSQSGDYLGSIVLRQGLKTSISFNYLSLAWYLIHMQGFVEASRVQPFFYAWAPSEFPDQVGFAWSTSNVRPTINAPRFVDVSLNVDAMRI